MRKFPIALSVSLLLVSALIYVIWSSVKSESDDPNGKNQSAGKEETSNEGEPTDDGVLVKIAYPTFGPISSFLILTSNVESERSVDIHPEISGLVKSLAVEEGDTVEAGDVLLYLVDDEWRIEMEESSMKLRYLESEFRRIEEIFTREMVTEQEFEDMKFQLEQARLALERAQLQLSRCTIRAPIGGIVIKRSVQLGVRVTNEDTIFHIADPEEMIALVHLPERYLSTMELDQPAIVTPGTDGSKPYTGRVKRLSPMVDAESGTFKVTVGLDPEQGFIPPGLFVTVKIITETHENAILLPKQSIVYQGDDRTVFIVEDNIAKKRTISVGMEDTSHVEVLSDFSVDTPVIVRGQNGLKNDTKVRIHSESPIQTSVEPIADS